MPLLDIEEAADYLNVSAAFVLRLIDRGEFDFQKDGYLLLLSKEELEQWKLKRDRERRTALDQLTEVMEEEGLYD